MLDLAANVWHPIASSDDLPFRHVYHGQLFGREMAVWRADDGNVNVWENRCLHRGVRLSIGINEGAELKCQYHGWRYANRSAGCTYIPAHPADAPARTITNRTFPVQEKHGLIWSSSEDDVAFADPLAAGEWFALRPIPVEASPQLVARLLATYRFQPNDALDGNGANVDAVNMGALAVALTSTSDKASTRSVFFVQPVDSGRAVIRGLLQGKPENELAVLRHHSHGLSALRRQIEDAARTLPEPEPIVPVYEQVPVELSTMPEIKVGRATTINVVVHRKWQAGADVMGFELAALKGHLPTFQPGAHVDVHLPNGLIRQYSITNGPGELLSYTIGVKREPDSRGGSTALHDVIREGDVLAISEPRNNFPLRRDATNTILIAGGIGITPMIAMAKALDLSHLPFELHSFARSSEHMAFGQDLSAFGKNLHPHLGLDPAATADTVRKILTGYGFAKHVYICGPGAMLEAVRAIATEQGWPEEAIHYEYFKNTKIIDDSTSFEIELARSALTLTVPAGKTILEVMRENGVDTPSSCEQGACGTCLTGVIDGVPDHQDVYLNDSEKASNTCIMTCVSRARTPRLVLDI